MFLAFIFIVIGLFMLLNALGIVTGNVWSILWAILILSIGIKLLVKKDKCPICGWKHWESKMHGNCDCEHTHKNDAP